LTFRDGRRGKSHDSSKLGVRGAPAGHAALGPKPKDSAVKAAAPSARVAVFTNYVYIEGQVIYRVELSRRAQRQLSRLPQHVAAKLLEWLDAVEEDGREEVRKRPGYHDEPLHGRRSGQRSMRLSHAYRAISVIVTAGHLELARVEEVTHHEY
jgi:proteic killer suppression protein